MGVTSLLVVLYLDKDYAIWGVATTWTLLVPWPPFGLCLVQYPEVGER